MRRARALALGGAFLCLAGALFGTPALYVPGIAALLGATIAPAWVWAASRGAVVTLTGGVGSVGEGESVELTVTVRRGLVPFPGGVLVPAPGSEPIALPVRRRVVRARISAVAPRRGLQTLGPARLLIADPLGISTCELASSEHELLVLPRVYPLGAGVLRRLGGRSQLRSAHELTPELDSLGRYVPGMPATRIHWPTVARTGTLMGRILSTQADPRAVVVIDARRPTSEQALDQALRATASLCVYLARRGGCALLLPGDREPKLIDPEMRGWPALHARLALLSSGGAVCLGRHLQSGRTVLYVTAAATGPAVLAGRVWRIGPHPLPGVGVSFMVAGCAGQIAGGAAMQRAA